jgi:uncharacterized Fe-S radical SAM superfamily protein PflX
MSKVKRAKKNEKTCLDCFHCKVSRKAIMTKGLCFCDKKRQIKEKTAKYWQEKDVCRSFEDSSA